MKKDLATYLLCLIGLCLCTCCTCKHSRLSALSAPAYAYNLSSEDVTAFTMDKNGYMWIGTSDGLNLFDGSAYRQYSYVPGDSASLAGNQINTLFRDSRDRIWVGTGSGVCQYIGYDRFKNVPLPTKQAYTLQILENSQGRLFFVTTEGVYLYDEHNNSARLALAAPDNNRTSTSRFFIDRQDRLWRVTTQDIQCYDQHFRHTLSLPNPAAYNMLSALMKDNCIWVSGGNGLLKYDIDSQRLDILCDSAQYARDDLVPREMFAYRSKIWIVAKDKIYSYNPQTRSLDVEEDMTDRVMHHYSSLISTVYVDERQDLWIGFPNGGFINLKGQPDRTILQHHMLTERLKGKSIRSLSAAEDGAVYGIQGNNSLFRYDPTTQQLTVFRNTDIEGILTSRFQHKMDKIFCNQGKIWLLNNSRLMRCRYNGKRIITEKIIRYGIQNTSIGNYCADKQGNLYVTTDKDCLIKVSGTRNYHIDTIAMALPAYTVNSCLQTLPNGGILICMPDLQLACYSPENGQVKPLDTQPTNYNPKGINPTCIYQDRQQQLWIGSDKGLYQLHLQARELTLIEPLANLHVSSMLEDKDGNLWIGTHQGMVTYCPRTKEMTHYSNTAEGTYRHRIFNPHSACMLQDSILIFGHTQGCSIFTPSALKQYSLPSIHIEKVLVNKANQTKGIDYLCRPDTNLHLKWNENDLTFFFSTVNYALSPQYTCRYKLEGFEHNWIESDERHPVIYSNLPAGHYTFRLRLDIPGKAETGGLEQHVRIAIGPAPWLSIPALVAYVILVAGIVFYINRLYLRIKAEHLKAEMLQRDKEREHLANQMNMNFFANISHEFRNPLTMIFGPIATLKKDKNLSGEAHRLLNVVSQSINQMLRLIDQMLDFNKLEYDALKMQITKCDIVDETNHWIDLLQAGARQKNIRVERSGLEGAFFGWLDKDKLGKILSNLFTNALKHTPQGGSIHIGFECIDAAHAKSIMPALEPKAERYLHIYVQDSGKGIPPEQLEDIFKRYYQADNKSGLKYANWGTGIGLYYVKRLVQLHHGEVMADNVKGEEAEKHGAIFHVLLPADESAYAADSRQEETTDNPQISVDSSIPAVSAPVIDPQKPTLMVVDDDTQVAAYLTLLLTPKYNIVNKYSAESALEALKTVEPDLILSDVIMGEMSGYDFCRKLKKDKLYCHIPIVLLTAKAQTGEQIEGLSSEASAYVTKPFDPDYLKTLIRSILSNRNHLRALLSSATNATKDIAEALSPQDTAFLKDLYKLMDSMMDQEDWNFNDVAEKLLMSRSKFNYKLKGLTGETPTHFFMKYKLNKAAELLRSGKYNVSEVADLTGFGTVSHFSVSFKKHFGVNPKDYK